MFEQRNSTYLAAILIFASAALLGQALCEYRSDDNLDSIVQADLNQISNFPMYSNFFNSIQSVATPNESNTNSDILSFLSKAVQTKNTGIYELQIEAYLVETKDLILEKQDHPLWLVQFSFFNLKSKNKILEISRSYIDKKIAQLVSQLGLKKRAGVVLLSHTVTRAIPSPQAGLTSEFGMGSGVAPLLKTPAKRL